MALTRILGSFKDAILAGGTESTFSGSKVSTGSFGRVEGTHIKMGINNNTIFGNKAGDAITTASGSTFIGEDAGGSTTTGPNNIAIGYDALNGGATTGGDNIVIGRSAGDALTSGTGNIVLGRNAGGATALADNTVIIGTGAGAAAMTADADGTVAIGYQAGAAITSGQYNIAVGFNAATALATGDNNVAIGYNSAAALTDNSDNIAIGYGALDAADGGEYGNVAIGSNAMGNVNHPSLAYDNVAIGKSVADGMGTIGGHDNVFIGNSAGGGTWVTSDSNYNIGIGSHALSGPLNDAIMNYAIGQSCMSQNSEGNYNVAMGYNTLSGNTDGESNSCFGHSAGPTITTGDRNVCIGSGADVVTGTHSNCIAIGKDVSASADEVSIGKSGNIITSTFTTTPNWGHSSDERKKRNIQDVSLGLDFVNDLRTVTFQWKPAEEHPEEWGHFYYEKDEDGNDAGEKIYSEMDTDIVMHGMVAQEVKAAMDSVGSSAEHFGGWRENVNGEQSLAPSAFVYPLIKAVQELSEKNEELSAEVNTLQAQISGSSDFSTLKSSVTGT